MNNIQHKIAKKLFGLFSFVEEITEKELLLREVLRGIGWNLNELAGFSLGELSDSLNPLSQDLKKLSEYVEAPPESFADFETILNLSEKLFNHINALKEVLENIEFDSPDKERLIEFVEDVLNYLAVLSLSSRNPVVFDFAVLLTLITGKERLDPITDVEGKVIRHPAIIPVLKLSRLSDLISDPVSLLREEYFPNGLKTDTDAIIAANKLFPRIAKILEHFGMNTVFGFNKEYGIDFGEHGNILNAGMLTAFAETDLGGEDLEFGITLSLSPESRGDLGLVVYPFGNFNFSRTFGQWLVSVKLSAGIAGFAIGRDDVTLLTDEDTASLDASIEVRKLPETEDASAFLWGSKDGSHLAIGSFVASTSISYSNAVFTFDIFVQAGESTILISPGDGDGFINSILPAEGLKLEFDFGLGWSNQSGLYFKGSAGTEAVYPIHKTILNTLVFEQLYLRFLANDSALKFESSLDFRTKIGPVVARVNNIGIKSTMSNLGGPGNIGFADLSLGFAPPKGIGIEVKSEVLTGGGFLELDYENHRYAGVLSLKLALEKLDIEIVAIGLITTRLPNSQKGFSMLISISVSFTPGFQLFFGFTLNGVGGLVGVHRTGKVDVLRERIQSGAMQSIMFPQNVIENASKIISDLRAIFPPQKKHYVVAPFFKIGYSTPTILEVDLGIMVEIPFKGRLILLGSLGLYLPNKDVEKRLGEIHVDIFGDFNFAESYILIEGRLRDSHLVDIPLTGGFAFMLDWGRDPQFLLSVGGYHPRYKKPDSFPVIARLAAMIKKGNNFRLSCEYYQAITSNSFQIGLSAEIVYKKGKAKAIGFLGFNAFLQFDPFYFEADIRISVDVSYRGRSFSGVDMEFILSGPKPWRAQGYAKIKVLFFSLKVKFNMSWGGEQKAVPVLIQTDALLEKLRLQLEQSCNWSAKLPEHYTKAESLRTLEETEMQDLIIIHPSGYLELRQKLVPLNRTIEKVGNSYVEAMMSYKISDYTFGGGDPVDSKAQKPLLDYFSRGQFEDLADSEKISTADFDLMSSGIEVAPEQAYDISSNIESTANDFEEIILREDESAPPTRSNNNWQVERAMNIRGGMMTSDDTRPEGLFRIYEELPDYKGKAFKIVSKDTLGPPIELTGQYFNSYSEAKDYLQIHWTEERQELWQILETEAVDHETVVME